jgi:O-Antigen ligase
VVDGALYGLSGLFEGFYPFSVWGPIAVVSAALLVAAAVASPLEFDRRGWLAVAGLASMFVWAAVSAAWAESLQDVWTEANRTGFYLVVLLTAIAVLRSFAHARAVVHVLAAAIGLVGLYVAARCLLGTGASLFVGFRLSDPLGYFNGEGAYFAMGFWALLAVAQAPGRAAVRGSALGLAVLLAGLAVLTQSRGAMLATAIAAVVVLVLFRGRLERAWLLVFAGCALAAAAPWLFDVYAERTSRPAGALPSEATVRAAVAALSVAAIAAGGLWFGLLRTGPKRWTARARSASVAVLAGLAVATAGAGLYAVGDPVAEVRERYDEFISLDPSTDGAQRFTSVGGYRYDYWRIAADAFADSPVRGLGAGNYPNVYLRERQNPDYVRQPHSLLLQLLAELGIVGAIAFALFAGAVLSAAVSRARRGGGVGEEAVVMACTGIFTVWLVQTNVDWLYNIAGVTGIALLAAGALLAGRERTPLHPAGPAGNIPSAVTMSLVILLAASVGVQWIADRYQAHAHRLVPERPDRALEAANRSLSLNPERLETYYTKSAAYARADDYASARRVLLTATRKDPDNYLPWALLGDLAVRRGDLAEGGRDYARASRLNPFDRELAALARTPEAAREADAP